MRRFKQNCLGLRSEALAAVRTMTPTQYRAAIARLGLSQRATARLFGVSERQSRRWALDEAEIPKAVEIALKMMIEFKVEPERFA